MSSARARLLLLVASVQRVASIGKQPGERQLEVLRRQVTVAADGTSAEPVRAVAVLAAGCFWGVELAFWRLPGVLQTEVGYTGGHVANPTYEQVSRGSTMHAEALRVTYDRSVISYEDLLDVFFDAHDPTTMNRQGNDVGTQYRSGAYWFDDEQKEIILASKAAYEKALGRTITTECAAASDYDQYGGVYYYAESYHRAPASRPNPRAARACPASRAPRPGLARLSLHTVLTQPSVRVLSRQSNTSPSPARGRTARRSRSRSRCRRLRRGRPRASRTTRPSRIV